jgi:hypothetical protein
MVKALSFFKRRAGMPVDEFQTYWRTHHPGVVTRLAGLRRYVPSGRTGPSLATCSSVMINPMVEWSMNRASSA